MNDSSTKINALKQKSVDLVSPIKLFILIFFIRLINAFTLQTYFQADEYYQCLEPAHNFVYGYGYITWEWKERLRSSIHPWLYALGYSFVGENRQLIEYMPKIIGAVIASIGEFYLYYFVKRYEECNVERRMVLKVEQKEGMPPNESKMTKVKESSEPHDLAWVTLWLSLLNPFNWYVSTRSFSNNLETTLTIVALYYWPWNQVDGKIHNRNWYTSLACGIVSCIIRPTNALIWLPLGIWLLVNMHKQISYKWIAFSLLEIVLLFAANTYLDYIFYGELTFPIYNFLNFNVIRNLSIFYGVAPWHFYIFQAVPLMMMLYLPLLVLGIYKSIKLNIMLITSLIYLIGFSTIQHKEFRFIMPLQPLMMYYASKGYHSLQIKYFIIPGIFLNMAIAIFFSNINERGVIDLTNYIAQNLLQSGNYINNNINNDAAYPQFGLIMPCHSTPWQSKMHNPDLNAWFLTCEPPLHLERPSLEEVKMYRDESDQFYDDPEKFLRQHILVENGKVDRALGLPEYIAIFEPLQEVIEKEMGHKYVEIHRFFNSLFHWDERRRGDIILYKRIQT